MFGFSQFGLVLANLALDLHFHNRDVELATRKSNNMFLDKTKEVDLSWNPGMSFHNKLTAQNITDQGREVGDQPIHLEGESARKHGGPHCRNKTGRELSLSHLFALV